MYTQRDGWADALADTFCFLRLMNTSEFPKNCRCFVYIRFFPNVSLCHCLCLFTKWLIKQQSLSVKRIITWRVRDAELFIVVFSYDSQPNMSSKSNAASTEILYRKNSIRAASARICSRNVWADVDSVRAPSCMSSHILTAHEIVKLQWQCKNRKT